MDTAAALDQIRKSCNTISTELMRLHPAANALEDKTAKDEMLKTLFELTRQVESIKKIAKKVEIQKTGDGTLPPEL